MDIDLKCLFTDLSDCDEIKTDCHHLLKPPTNPDDRSSLFGCRTKIEYLLFQYGKFDMSPCNLEQFSVCNKHIAILPITQFKNCCLCKSFGRLNSSKSGLRPVTNAYAFAAWKQSGVRLSFARIMCTQCRNQLEKFCISEEFKRECDNIFQWLYDTSINHTPSNSTSDSFNVLSQSFNDLFVEDKQSLMRQFLQEIDCFDQVPTTTSFANLHSASKQRFCRQSTKILKCVLGLMAPNDDVDVVWQANLERYRNVSSTSDGLSKELRVILTSFAEAYHTASHWTVRRQILSIMAKDVSFSTVRLFIPNLTVYRFNIARRHADFNGKGLTVDDTRTPTIRYEDYQLEHFIEFIVSPHICTDLPFGEKELHLSSGETLLIPLTIRNLAPQRIINQYYKYCDEYYGNTFRPLSQSTLFSVLKECTATTRRSLQGLDSYSSDGSTAFDILTSIVEGLSTLGLTASDAAETKQSLQNSRNYLKTDYKVHVSSSSTVPDHCSTFSLSDTKNKCFQQRCDHNHDQQCDRCELLKTTLATIRRFIEQYQLDDTLRTRLLFRFKQQVQCIEDWKAHLLRTVHQDQARIHVLNHLDNETVMIYVDWAMKWIPTKYRESTKDHFAKRGISWHIAYVIHKTSMKSTSSNDPSFDSKTTSVGDDYSNHIFQHKTFCHIFDQCIQNAKTVTSILRHLFLRLQQTMPSIKYIHLRSDNAGCYHSGDALLSIEQLFKETGIWIKSIDFCDPQSGKSACDRMAAVIKCSVRRFINERNNCTNAAEFLIAAERTKGVEFYASEIKDLHTEKVEWSGVKQINNVEYKQVISQRSKSMSTQVRTWQSWQIGPGEVYQWSDFGKPVQTITPLIVLDAKNVSNEWVCDSYEKEDKKQTSDSNLIDHNANCSSSEDEEESDQDSPADPFWFDCLIDGCTARYRYYAHLLRHYTIGKHQMKLEKHSLIDKSKSLFHYNLTTNYLRSTPLLSITVVPSTAPSTVPPLSENWASQRTKPSVRFNQKQHQFLQGKFNEGVQTGMKWDPVRVAFDMETIMEKGNFFFKNEECLSAAQIKSYFSRLAAKQQSTKKAGNQQSPSTVPSSSSSALTTHSIDTNTVQSKDTLSTDDSYDTDETDERDLDVYTWRQTFDEARLILDTNSSSSSSTTSLPISTASSNMTPSLKRKSTKSTSQAHKYKTK